MSNRHRSRPLAIIVALTSATTAVSAAEASHDIVGYNNGEFGS